MPTERIIGLYIERSSDGDYEFVAAIDREMFTEEGSAEAVVSNIKTGLEAQGDVVKLFGFEATDQIVDIMEEGGEQ